jgi:hypothetical protein
VEYPQYTPSAALLQGVLAQLSLQTLSFPPLHTQWPQQPHAPLSVWFNAPHAPQAFVPALLAHVTASAPLHA